MRRAAVALLVALGALAPVARAEVPETPIQPGAVIFSPIGQCTMNFVFGDDDHPDVRYIGTAGHCASRGQRVSSSDGEFGTTVFSRRTTVQDFALIKIDPGRYDQVSARMRYWGGPSYP